MRSGQACDEWSRIQPSPGQFDNPALDYYREMILSLKLTGMNIKKEIIRFSIAGTFVGVTDFGIYYFLIHFLSFSLAKGISFTCAGIVAYLFNKHWIFQYNRPASYAEVSRYTLINFLALGINVLTNQSILKRWPGAVFLALLTAAMVTGLSTFICYKWWVFKAQLTARKL